MSRLNFSIPELSTDAGEVAALAALEGSQRQLAESVRRLVDLTVRTTVPVSDLDEVTAAVDALADRLARSAQEGPLGLQRCSDGRVRDHGNPAVGRRNPIAPPLSITRHPDFSAETHTVLGAAYEGPPGHVHGGIVAMILDQILGAVTASTGKPGLTAYLNVTYRRPTPLGALSCHGEVVERGEWKTLVRGEMRDAEGRVTAEAEGLFVIPSWARGLFDTPQSDAGDYEGH